MYVLTVQATFRAIRSSWRSNRLEGQVDIINTYVTVFAPNRKYDQQQLSMLPLLVSSFFVYTQG